jgi:hypothetical protein
MDLDDKPAGLRRGAAVGALAFALLMAWPISSLRAQNIPVLACRDNFNGTMLKITTDQSNKTVRMEIPSTGEVLEFTDGKLQNICRGECGATGTMLSSTPASANIVTITDTQLVFGAGGNSNRFTIDRQIGTMTPSNRLLDSFMCVVAIPF